MKVEAAASPQTFCRRGFSAGDPAKDGGSQQAVEAEATRGFTGAEKAWDDLASKIHNLAFGSDFRPVRESWSIGH